jgi:hypothetical protein
MTRPSGRQFGLNQAIATFSHALRRFLKTRQMAHGRLRRRLEEFPPKKFGRPPLALVGLEDDLPFASFASTRSRSAKEADEIGRSSDDYAGVLSDDPHAAGEALALFTSDTIACLDHLR